jgi:hypothetical protein
VRQTYVKAQAIRRRRRASENRSNRLSFEDGAVFALSPDANHHDLTDDSSPASEAVDEVVDDEWAEEWEEEYRHAVEIEGEPDDLVLGIMDEEEKPSERR